MSSPEGGVPRTEARLLARLKTEVHAPAVPPLVPPTRPRFLAPEAEWRVHPADPSIIIPAKAYRPKVQVELSAGPRKVLAERLQRQYAVHNMPDLLADLGLGPDRLQAADASLPLHFFDDRDFDSRLPEEWLELGLVDGVQHPVPAEAWTPWGHWVDVAVTGLEDGEDGPLYTAVTLDGRATELRLPRLLLRFKAEDPVNFAHRLVAATNHQDRAHAALRYQTILDCMILHGLASLSDDSMGRILNSVIRGGSISIPEDWIEEHVQEVKMSYMKAMGDLSFRGTIRNFPDTYRCIEIPQTEERPVPQIATVSTGMEDFEGRRALCRRVFLYAIPEAYSAMLHVVGECLAVREAGLFATNLGRGINLGEFVAAEKQTVAKMMLYLKTTWAKKIAQGVSMHLRDVGKGWFNISETKWYIYQSSKLERLMWLIKFHMQEALRDFVTSSVSSYTKIVEAPCLSTLELAPEFSWSDDLTSSPFGAVQPLFTLQLRIDDTGVALSTDPDRFQVVLADVLNEAVRQTHTIPQVHPLVLTNLRFAEDVMLTSVGLAEEYVRSRHERIVTSLRQAALPLKAYTDQYRRFIQLWETDVTEYLRQFQEEKHSTAEMRDEAVMQFSAMEELEASLPDKLVIGPYLLLVAPLKRALISKRKEMYDGVLNLLAASLKEQVDEVLSEYKAIMRKLTEKPASIEEILDMRDWMETVPTSMAVHGDVVKRLVLEYDMLERFWFALEQEDFDAKWEAVGFAQRIDRQVQDTAQFLAVETERLKEVQASDEVELRERMEELDHRVQEIAQRDDMDKVHEVRQECSRLWDDIRESQETAAILVQRQKTFKLPPIVFEELPRLRRRFEPYKSLWVTASDWLKWEELWMNSPLVEVDGEAIDSNVTDSVKTMTRLFRTFSEVPGAQRIAEEIKAKIEEFRPHVSLIQALRKPGMKPRHWQQISDLTGIEVSLTPTLTFRDCVDMGLGEHAATVEEVADVAEKEYGLEKSIAKINAQWDAELMELTPYKDTGTYIMKVSEETVQMLDDHLILAQQMSFSPHKGEYEQQLSDLEDRLRLAHFVVDEWFELQKRWMYLQPIFTSESIKKHLPMESKMFLTMERLWRRIMSNALENPKVLDLCADRGLLRSLQECNQQLEKVEKGLVAYLETKRDVFPRFYFLSDEELLEILSDATDPTAVQPHLRKCFENIAKLKFEDDLAITAMFSADGERIELRPSVRPVGDVESWLLQVEESMRSTLRETLADALQDPGLAARGAWVLRWPGQLVIAGSQTDWTAAVESAVLGHTLPAFYASVLEQMDVLRDLVRGKLEWLQRQVLSALIVIEVHARDVVANLLEHNVASVNDFEWISQLRYYWVEDDLKIRMVNAEFPYGYEYLGNTGRLVITPLTDRCYLTLTGALHLKFGGAPAGPAGTGKTETTKDLGKAFAVQCVVFNCSDQLDFKAMGKFFKGLASAGAWACFDEFNRIDVEVLSVVAQQIMTIQRAQMLGFKRFLFEEREIALKASCAVFITMNPGYAGRTELPDNLKALFRPVAMMVPDYTLIAEISLFSFGFAAARDLAGKITSTFRLSSEQLSAQDHYDFGMRAVKTVIAVAGNLKREHPDMEERQVVLRALRDVNVPKFLSDDLKLFDGIVSDLFPRMEQLAVDYGVLEAEIRRICAQMLLEDVAEFVKKVIQLYETTVVRHGLMIVGPTGSGKTKCYEVLQKTMTNLKGQPSPSGQPFEAVLTYVLNPKAITLGQLYGEYDLLTREWSDGILSTLVRQGSAAVEGDKRWYVLDGPVDAVWIENMNTVLDDNKKLCLSSGEIIMLRPTQTMMFEVADLAVASPATVSRCGMVYMEPGMLGLQPFVRCWLQRLPPLAKEHEGRLTSLVEWYVLPALEFLRSDLEEKVPSVDSCLVVAFQQLVDSFLLPLQNPSGKPPPPPPFLALMPALLSCWAVFSLVWSVGATCDAGSRPRFSSWLRDRMKDAEETLPFPDSGIVYDYRLYDGGFSTATPDGEPQQPSWVHWMEGAQEYVIGPDTNYSDIEVPTIDIIRNSSLLGTLVEGGHPVLCVGNTGTCKTITVTSKLTQGMEKKFVCEFLIFSARTTANQTQDMMESKLDRRRRAMLGPPLMKKMVFFIDDFNMPALEVYGAQPPIELIRQWMDFQGWYDRKVVGEFTTLVDCGLVAAMGPPGGGRNPVTPRLLRHFHHLAFPELEHDSKVRIFGTILRSWLARNETLAPLQDAMVQATLGVYDTIRRELLPTPAKIHYTFNLRDLSRVFRGVLMAPPESIQDFRRAVRLWFHECCRVFQDRLVDDADRSWFDDLLRSKLTSIFKQDPDAVLGDWPFHFGAFLEPLRDVKVYEEITDMDKLSHVLENYLEDFNHGSRAPMKLVLFLDAIAHICRIARTVRQPMGNALLLGMGGSGRRSLTQLATFVCDLPCERVELTRTYGLTEWRDDLRKLMLSAGVRRREAVFLFSDTQIKSESFLEDLNNVLNSGDVPNIYPPEDLEQIYQAMRVPVGERGLPPTKPNLFAAYQRLVMSNLHVAIAMSPIGEAFRARLRQFPALINCCTIDWFRPWPEAALRSVALQFLREMPDLEVDDLVMDGIVTTCQHMHQTAIEASGLYLQELSRHIYITPTSYLELLNSFDGLLTKKKNHLKMQALRLSTGQEKMQETEKSVTSMQARLNEMIPLLNEAVRQTDEQFEQIQNETAEVDILKQSMMKEEAEAELQAERTAALAADAERDLAAALPDLEEALASVRALDKGHIAEVRTMMRPPVGVRLVLEAVCILKGIPALRVLDHTMRGYVNDFWEPSKQMLSAPDFQRSLEKFDKDSIPQDIIDKLEAYIQNPEFMPEKVAKASVACKSLCKWVHAIYRYHFVNLDVKPKKEALAKAREDLEKMMRLLEESRRKMQEVLERLARLEAELKSSVEKKTELEQQMQTVDDRLRRALRLLAGLDRERRNWQQEIGGLHSSLQHLPGDVLITAGAVAYLGSFTDTYRAVLLYDWWGVMLRATVPHTQGCTPVSTMGDPIVTRGWQLAGLPRDTTSTESALLVSLSSRWPLFIDPQQQAARWIKRMEKQDGLVVARLTDKDLLRTLETAVWFGKPYLIEDVGEDLDPSLDTVLLRQVFVQGGTRVIAIGDNIVPYHESFRLYITTKLANPHYSPEVAIKVMIVNFALVPSGLQDQMLALVVTTERPDLETLRSSLVVSHHQMTEELKQLGDRILQRITTAEGELVDDIELILMLEATKIKTEEIQVKVEEAVTTQAVIDTTRALYIPVATRAQILFFCVSNLAAIDPMYQYSLEWFVNIFVGSMEAAEHTTNTEQRIASINGVFTFDMFSNVCRSLFERHKQHFAFLMVVRILLEAGRIDAEEYRVFLSGGAAPAKGKPKPALDWLTDRAWNEIQSLEVLPKFREWVSHFMREGEKYKAVFDSPEPHREPLPAPWEGALNDFQHMMVVKCLRPDKVVNAMQDYIVHHLGRQFVEPQAADLDSLYRDSSPTTPLVFVLSAGTDPAEDFYKFADQKKFTKKVKSISLGQGQGEKAEILFKTAVEQGNWVYFQNCHLSPSWMPDLEMLVQNLAPDDTNRDFRLWLTAMPSPHFPVSILQNSSKMTVEPPRGIQANMLRAYMNHVPDFKTFMGSADPKVPAFHLLQLALCLFHSVCLERRKFGPLGFNIAYEFTDGDLRICLSQLKMFLLEYDDVPFKVLQFTAGEINYGGRVTDDWDRRCIKNLLDDFYDTKILDESYSFDEDGIYHQLSVETSLAQYVAYMRTLPLNDSPAIFGLHENANMSYAQAETFSCLATLLQLQPRAVSGDSSADQEEVTAREAAAIDRAVPPPFNLAAAAAKYPVLYEESLNTVLVQEVIRYNRLLNMIHNSISKMLNALKGLVVMSEDLENMSQSIFNNSVPHLWETFAYPSLKPLGAWVKDLQKRVEFVQKWIDEGVPPAFWISGFYFPQAFLTGTMQNFARKYVISIDTIGFAFEILDELPTKKPEDGCCIYGLYLEGCRWSSSQHFLTESRLKELYTGMAGIWLIPEQYYQKPSTGIYECPVYKTLTRAGVLSTTGHSTNYVLTVEIPSNQPQKHWIKRGVALICALDY